MRLRHVSSIAAGVFLVPGMALQVARGAPDEQSTAPQKAFLLIEKTVRDVTLVARTDGEILFTTTGSALGPRARLYVSQVDQARFPLEIDFAKLRRAEHSREWETAIRLLYPAIQASLPYLDLKDNNALPYAVQVADYMMRSAARSLLDAETEEERQKARDRYTICDTVLRFIIRAEWSEQSVMARLKRCRCFLAMGKPKTARQYLARVDEPRIGDITYGLYWLVKAELDVEDRDWRPAIKAAVKSLCFENKDIGTFPDALMVSAQCYEEMQQWYRARDVYYEVARIFPRTDWAETSIRRLKFIMDRELTKAEEKSPIEDVFFGLREDMNQNVLDLLEGRLDAEDPVEGAPEPGSERAGTGSSATRAAAPEKPRDLDDIGIDDIEE